MSHQTSQYFSPRHFIENMAIAASVLPVVSNEYFGSSIAKEDKRDSIHCDEKRSYQRFKDYGKMPDNIYGDEYNES